MIYVSTLISLYSQLVPWSHELLSSLAMASFYNFQTGRHGFRLWGFGQCNA